MRTLLSGLSLLVVYCSPAASQNAAEKANKLLALQTRYTEAALSPDGKQIAWVESIAGANGEVDRDTAIYVAQTNRLEKRRITAGTGAEACAEDSLAWAPDGQKLAFLSDCGKAKQPELYTTEVSGGKPQQQTTLTGYLSHPTWAPDGKSIALLFIENANREAGPLVASHRDAGVVEEHFQEQRLTLIELGTRAVHLLSPADTYVYEYDWSSDSRRLAYTAAKGNGDNNWWIAELFTIDAQSGKVTHVLRPAAQIAEPHFSPDGSTIAFIGGIMSDEGSTGGDIYAVSSSGGEALNLTPGRKASPNWLKWLPSNHILFTETVDGSSAVGSLNPATKETEGLWAGDESIRAGANALSVADDGKTVATVRSGWKLAPEVWSGPLNEWKKQTAGNDNQKQAIGKAEKLHWMSGGAQVEGWLVYPLSYDPAKRYPMVVIVHGGPAAAVKPRWPSEYDNVLLSAEGYFVLMPNPRGSYGSGESFTQGNVKDFGYGDLKDINAGVDEALRTLPIDANRLGVTGWSYGGFMTMWTVTQTHRFHAAVAGAGISNWQSYYGENLIDQWMIPYFGASVYDDPKVYARSSPITYIKDVRTPTLIVVGDSDAECPAPQSYEFWHALKTLGVKTQLVVYPDEGHAIRQPQHRADIMRRLITWFNENLPG